MECGYLWLIIVSKCTDYNVLCLDASGYVTTGNSGMARGFQDSVGTHHSHFQSRIDETVLLDITQCILL